MQNEKIKKQLNTKKIGFEIGLIIELHKRK
jgi:hypothetical protein